MVYVTLFTQIDKIASQIVHDTFQFIIYLLSVRKFNLLQVPLVPWLKRLVSHTCHAV